MYVCILLTVLYLFIESCILSVRPSVTFLKAESRGREREEGRGRGGEGRGKGERGGEASQNDKGHEAPKFLVYKIVQYKAKHWPSILLPHLATVNSTHDHASS